MTDGKEVRTMTINQFVMELARERQEQLIAESSLERRARRSRPSIRRSIGRRVIAVGERIAAERPLELARSR
jgi:hypothetical protein